MTPSVAQRQNPYIIGPPVRNQALFFGREELFQFIADNLRKDANVILLHGQRRIGKSSVLRQIPLFVGQQQELQDQFFFFRFDLQDQARLPLAQVLRNLAAELRDHPDGALPVTPPALEELQRDPSLFATEFLPQVYRALGRRKLVLLLDEFDVLGSYTDETAATHFFPFLQGIVYRHDRLVIIPVVGRRLEEIPTLLGLFREAPSQEIGLLDERSARRLITQPVSGWLSYSEDAIKAILELTAGHPYFTQLVCYVLCARAKADGRERIEAAEVEACVDEVLVSGEGGLAWFRDGLPIPERVYFSAVAEMAEATDVAMVRPVLNPAWELLLQHGVLATKKLLAAAERLEKWGYIRRVAEIATSSGVVKGRHHQVTVKLVQHWLRKRYPFARALLELERVDEQAQQKYREAGEAAAAGDPTAALALYHETLSLNPNHFSALFESAEATLVSGHYHSAIELYQRAHLVDPARTKRSYIEALIGDANIRMQDKQYQQARDEFARVLQLQPDHTDAQAGLKNAEAALRRKLAAHNPFTLAPVSSSGFVGRQEEVATIFSKIRSRGHVAIHGPAGIGKTSLLQHVAAPDTWRNYDLAPTAAIVVLLNCQSIALFNRAAFWRELLLSIQDQVVGDGVLHAYLDEVLRDFTPDKTDLRRTLRRLGKPLVLLLDEFDALLKAETSEERTEVRKFLGQFRSLIVGASDDQLSTVIATRRPLSEVVEELATKLGLTESGSPFTNMYLPLPLKPLAEKEFEALVAMMPAEFKLSEVELAWARHAGEGRPNLLQAAFDLLYRHHASEEAFDLTRVQQDFAPHKAAFLKTS